MTSGADTDGRSDAVYLIRAYLETGNYDRARDMASRQLTDNPDDAELLVLYADAELRLENFEGAAESAEAAIAIAPSDVEAMRVYVLAIDALGRNADALEMAWRSATDHPDSAAAHGLYARMLYEAREFYSALIVVDYALRLSPKATFLWLMRGLILKRLGRIEESSAAYESVLKSQPDNAEALHNLALNRLARGKLDRALAGLLGAARLDPAVGDVARVNIGFVLSKMLSRASLVTFVLGIAISIVGVVAADGGATLGQQMAVGLLTALLGVAFYRMQRVIPPGVLRSAIRGRPSLVIRIVHAVASGGVGSWITVMGASLWSIWAGLGVAVSSLFLVKVDP